MRRPRSAGDLAEQLREIAALSRAGCVERWTDTFGQAPPKYASVRFMQRVLARELQIRLLGDYPPQLRRELKDLGRAATHGEKPAAAARPGSCLLREWNGRVYRVEVTPAGYVLDGQTYRSLTTIARRITGAHWSGPRFFGLRTRKAG